MGDAARKLESSASAQQIVRAAARLFATKGYDATSVREITDAAGVTKPTLYYHFGSKEGLAHALLTVPTTLLSERLGEIVARGGDVVDQIGDLMEMHFDYCREEPDRLRFLFSLIFGPMAGGGAAGVLKHTCEMDELTERLVRRAADSGVIRSADAGRFLMAIKAQVAIHTIGHLYKGLNLEPGLGHQLVRDLLHGFGTPAARITDDGKGQA